MAQDEADWRALGAEVGFVVAPAGLDYVTSGTTEWIYSAAAGSVVGWLSTAELEVRSTGSRIPFDANGLREQGPLLHLVEALWQRGLERSGLRPPRICLPRPLPEGLPAADPGYRGLSLRTLIGAVGVLVGLRFVPDYHGASFADPSPYYVHDMMEHGLTVFLIRRPETSPTGC